MSAPSPPARRVCVLGLWHLGSVASACLASLGYRVTGWDPDPARVRQLAGGAAPVYEPGLAELIGSELAARRLSYVDDLARALAGAGYVLIAFDTPLDEDDRPDVGGITAAAEATAPHLQEGVTVVVMSQVPAGTCEELGRAVRRAAPRLRFHLACYPENLKLGRALDRFLRPPVVVLGADEAEALDTAARLLRPISAPRLRTDLRTAEMTKHALNAFSATCVSFAGELAALCEEAGADASALAEALAYDERVGRETPLKPGLGFAGGTLARDLQTLRALGDRCGVDTPLLDAVLAVNQGQKQRLLDKLRRACGPLDGLAVSVFGLTYKPGTSTLRRSFSLDLIASLAAEGSAVRAYDPRADPKELPAGLPLTLGGDPYETARGSDAVLLLTAWPEFRDLDYRAIGRSMRRPVLLDAVNMLDRDALLGCGFRYLGMGR